MNLEQHKKFREKFESNWLAGRYAVIGWEKEFLFSFLLKAYIKRLKERQDAGKQKTT